MFVDPDSLLSVSLWREEAAVAQWRRHAAHGQRVGRARGIFRDLSARCAVVRDYGLTQGREAGVRG